MTAARAFQERGRVHATDRDLRVTESIVGGASSGFNQLVASVLTFVDLGTVPIVFGRAFSRTSLDGFAGSLRERLREAAGDNEVQVLVSGEDESYVVTVRDLAPHAREPAEALVSAVAEFIDDPLALADIDALRTQLAAAAGAESILVDIAASLPPSALDVLAGISRGADPARLLDLGPGSWDTMVAFNLVDLGTEAPSLTEIGSQVAALAAKATKESGIKAFSYDTV